MILFDWFSRKREVHFLHIGKTGGTALKHALESARGGSLSLHLHAHLTTLSDIPVGQKVFFFVRDPIARFVSGFYSRQRRGMPRYLSKWSKEEELAFSVFSHPDQLASALSDGDTDIHEAAIHAMKNIQHVRDSYWRWLGNPAQVRNRSEDILFIGQQEHLESDVKVLGRLLRRRIKLPTDPVTAHRNPSQLDRSLSENAISNLRIWFAEDYAALELCSEMAREKRFGGSWGADRALRTLTG